ncbi:hypothetical protein [Anabaena sp. UHCC 0399]|uniref:hypothetical protein n=1 Tax=Anabaena sp. UHCC 0399 TaxID=3110238 RepID=UPI002B20692E|nr:hypothetical protein [Anabaena sp. UHCC 0399]MEA5567547.1 hypothetical protein [Anabaena sp. UHCC 0399]
MSQKIKELGFVISTTLLVGGSLGLAVVDKDYRPVFADIVQVCLGGYVGWVTSNQHDANKDKNE